MMRYRLPIKYSVLILSIFAIVSTISLLSYLSLKHMETGLSPELHKKAYAIGESLQSTLEKITGYDVNTFSKYGKHYHDGNWFNKTTLKDEYI